MYILVELLYSYKYKLYLHTIVINVVLKNIDKVSI